MQRKKWGFTPVTSVTVETPKIVQTVSGDTPKTASQFKYQMVPGDEKTPMPGTSNVGVGASLMINGEGETSFGDITYKNQELILIQLTKFMVVK